MRKNNGYWNNEENCRKAAKECHSKSEFEKKYPAAYKQAKKVREDGKRWIDNYGFTRPVAYNIKWKGNYDACKEAADECDSRSEFSDKYPAAYNEARIQGWLDEWFERQLNVYENTDNVVYAFIFEKFNSIYIGRTRNITKRMWQHMNDNKCTVFKFAQHNGVVIPQMTILKSDIKLIESAEWEDYYVKKYKEEGWNVLNKAKTGKNSGSLGSCKRGIYTYNKMYNIAKDCKTRSELRNKCSRGYIVALEEGWLDKFDWLAEVTNQPKTVLELNLKNELLAFYKSTGEAAKRTGNQQQKISAVCCGKRKTTGGRVWIYDTVDSFLIDKMNRTIRNRENIAA